MKRTRVTVASLMLMLPLIGGLASGGIDGSKHDFSNQAWSADDKCGACHTPHRAGTPKAAPLWNPKADLTRRFGTSVTGAALPGNGTLVCLRCHDGGIASDMVPSAQNRRLVNKQNPSLSGTGHGGTDHPVGVPYPGFDRGYEPLTKVVAQGTVVLPDGKVECVSCHDPHDTSGTERMLVTSNARSALCLTCHRK
jgi:predicted CXXCH cytochrome family protein